MNEDFVRLTPQQAMECMDVQDGSVHGFVCASFGLIGADHRIDSIWRMMNRVSHPDHIQIAGEQAKSMNHAIAIYDTVAKMHFFFASKPEKIAEYEQAEASDAG